MNTRTENLIDVLVTKKRVGATGRDFLRGGTGVDYRKYISNLRKENAGIVDVWEKNGRDRYKRYFLEEFCPLTPGGTYTTEELMRALRNHQ